MARYLERAENTARVLEVNHTLLLDFHVPMDQQWRPLLIISGIHDFKPEATDEIVQGYMTWDADNPFSIISSLSWARENARIIREVISAEMWERMNYYHLWMNSSNARGLYEGNRSEFYAQVRRINQLLHGICDATVSHGEAWEFFRLGTYLERATQTARIMDVKYHTLLPTVDDVGTPVDNAHWVAILMSCSGYEPFHKKPRLMPIDPGMAVAEFLIFDREFPRSIRRSLGEVHTASAAIAAGSPNEVDRLIDHLTAWLDGKAIQDVVGFGLHESLTYVVNTVAEIGNAVHKVYFDAPVVPPKQLPSESTQTQKQTQN